MCTSSSTRPICSNILPRRDHPGGVFTPSLRRARLLTWPPTFCDGTAATGGRWNETDVRYFCEITPPLCHSERSCLGSEAEESAFLPPQAARCFGTARGTDPSTPFHCAQDDSVGGPLQLPFAVGAYEIFLGRPQGSPLRGYARHMTILPQIPLLFTVLNFRIGRRCPAAM